MKIDRSCYWSVPLSCQHNPPKPSLQNVLLDLRKESIGLRWRAVLASGPAEKREELSECPLVGGKFHGQAAPLRLAHRLADRFVAGGKQSTFITSQIQHVPVKASRRWTRRSQPRAAAPKFKIPPAAVAGEGAGGSIELAPYPGI